MRTATRFPLERIAVLDRAVRAGEYPNARMIGERLEVCRRTVLRDVEFLRDRLGAPIAYDPVRNGYFYTDPNFRLPVVAMTEGELLALVLAERAFQQYRGTPYGPDLARAIGKIARGLDDVVTIDLGKLAAGCSFRASPSPSLDPGVFRDLGSAVKDRRKVRMEYWTASRDVETLRIIDPYHLACVEGRWYLIAHCRLRGAVKTFSISRIRGMEVLDESFERPDDFDVNEYLSHSLSIFRGAEGRRYAIRLRFQGVAARYVREQAWHPSQTAEETPDGGLIVGMTLSHLREVERWILSWTPDCEVLEPPELKRRVASALRKAARLNAAPPE